MTETNNFFKNPNGGENSGWGAGVGGLIGAAVGSGGFGGFGGNREPAVTPDQLQATINGLQGQMSTDALQAQIGRLMGEVGRTSADSTLALGAGIAGVKDAVTHASSHNQLALCGLGHSVQAGMADIKNTIVATAAQGRELALSQDNANLRAMLAQAHNDKGHVATQVLLNQVIAGNG